MSRSELLAEDIHSAFCDCRECGHDATAENVPYAGEECNTACSQEACVEHAEVILIEASKPTRSESLKTLAFESICLLTSLYLMQWVARWLIGR